MRIQPQPMVYMRRVRDSIERFQEKDCLHVKRNGAWVSWSYGDLRSEWSRLVPALRAVGVAKDVNGIVIGENTPEWLLAYHAIILAGGCTVPVDPNLPPDEIREIVRQTEPKVVFCAPVFEALFKSLATQGLFHGRIVLLPPVPDAHPGSFRRFAESVPALADPFDLVFSPEDPMVIIFTSGTTGKAKGAVLLQRNFVSSAHHGVPRMGLDHNNRTLAMLPLHHVFGFVGCVTVELLSGMEIIFLPVVKSPLIMEALQEKHVTILPGVPQMVELFHESILRNVRAKGPVVVVLFTVLRLLSRFLGPIFGQGFRRKLFGSVHRQFGGALSLIISGGSSLRAVPFRAFREMGFNIVEGYGLTETFGAITICPSSDARLGSVGPVIEDNELRIDKPDATGIGEVCFRGATVFAGYYRNEAETRRVFDEAGWFHTGDLGRVTRDGFLYITGRIKDVIILESGKNVYPDEIEEYYLTHSDLIEEIGVLGIPKNGNESAAGVIVPTRDFRRRHTLEEATALIRAELANLGRHLPSYKKITEFRVSYHPLPRTSTRKIRKPDLRPLFSASSAKGDAEIRLTVAETEAMDSAEFRQISAFLMKWGKKAGFKSLTPRTLLEIDLQLDSLTKVELLTWLEQSFRFTAPENGLQRLESVGDALALVLECRGKGEVAAGAAIPAAEMPPVRTRPPGFIYQWGLFIIHQLSRMLYGLSVKGGREVPEKGGLIFCPNHESYLDAVWVLSSLSRSIRRKTYVIGKRELFRNPVLRFLLSRTNVIAVEREGDVRDALSAAETVLREGKNLLIFPEGTRTRTENMGRFRSGVGELMHRTDALAIPVRVRGGRGIWPVGRIPKLFFARKYHASVSFGEAVSMADLNLKIPEFTPDLAAREIRHRVEALA
jgi:long-chain acyl-CoA synthetase